MGVWQLDHNVASEPVVLVDGVVIGGLREPYASQVIRLREQHARLLVALEAALPWLQSWRGVGLEEQETIERIAEQAREAIREVTLDVQKEAKG